MSVPFRPVCGRVGVKPLPWKPSKLIDVVSNDRAMISEGIVTHLSDKRLARLRRKNGDIVSYGEGFEHEIKLGDRVVFQPVYQDDDYVELNGERIYFMDSWKIAGVITEDRPEGYQLPDGSRSPETHPLFT